MVGRFSNCANDSVYYLYMRIDEMQYVKEAVEIYAVMFAFTAFFMFGAPLAFCFMMWDWELFTFQTIMALLRVTAVLALVISFLFVIDQVKSK